MTHNQEKPLSPETLVAQALGREDPVTGAIIAPVSLSTTFSRHDDYSARDNGTYLRDHGPTQKHAEDMVCELEGGAQALSFGSGAGGVYRPFSQLKER